MSDVPIRVLLVEDDDDDYWLTRKVLGGSVIEAFDVKWVRTYDEAITELGGIYDVCLLDYRLGANTGLEVIEEAIARGSLVPIILLTGRGDREVDIQAMRAGAADYLVKDEITPPLVERVVRHAIERRIARAALAESEGHLRQAQKMEAVGSLAGGMAHDFNNLLSIILSYSELLVMNLEAGDPMRADLEAINAAGTRAAGLTRQLLAFSRRQVLQPKITNLNDVCTGMEKMLQRLLGEDVELATRTAPSLDWALLDPGQIEQVIMNLVVNARDAMPKGGTLTIETSDVHLSERDAAQHMGIKPGPHVMLSVTDTGIGMDAATQAHMFEPFFTTKEIGRGTGLGLSTVFGIVKQSGGAIWVQSAPGKGTTFKTCFPVARPDIVSAVAVGPPPSIQRRTLRGTETVLVVEDEDGVRGLACTILRRYGYTVLEAHSGGDALIASEQHKAPVDLLLTDVVMPRMNGPELARRLLSIRPDMKVLFMSGYPKGAQLPYGQGASSPEFLQKPITPVVLARKVREVLERSRNSFSSDSFAVAGAHVAEKRVG